MAINKTTGRRQYRTYAVVRMVILAAILICVNMLAVRFHYGIDLTKEKRYSVTPATRALLQKMNDVAVIDVYLQGRFPAGFQKLREATREELQTFKNYAGNHIIFRFIDPQEGKSDIEKENLYRDFEKKGMSRINLQVNTDEEGYSEKFIFPYALVHYLGKEKVVPLLENRYGMAPLEILNYSESLLEYKFATALQSISKGDKPRVGYMLGNGEIIGANTYSLLSTLPRFYSLDTIDMANITQISAAYKAIIINKPALPFSDKDKFKIDQYVMHGGHILWGLDMLNTPMDSLRNSEQFLALDYGLNLDDLLFNFGVRINTGLIEDIQCAQLPLITGMNGDKPQIELRNWVFFPVFTPNAHHPIVNNMDAILGKFANDIDTIADPNSRKTILLQSSKYSRVAAAPVRVSLSMMRYPPQPQLFNKGNRPVAVLSEGRFRSIFRNRLPRSFLFLLDSLKQPFKPACDSAGKMIILSDGDLMTNDYSNSKGPLEMGYWEYTKDYFSNKDFILNCLEYLTDNAGLLEARSKRITLRLLDAGRVKEEKTKWQAINIAVPIAIVLVFASCYLFFRKRRYEGNSGDNNIIKRDA